MRVSFRGLALRTGLTPGTPLFDRLQHAYSLWWPHGGARSFSQYGEDAVLMLLFPSGTGTYVDVCAGSPRQGSNTYALYRRGWHGTLIEPIPQHVRALKLLRPRDQVVEAACGEEQGHATLFEFRPYQFSTLDESAARRLIAEGRRLVARRNTPIRALRDLEVTARPQFASVLNIDTEGFESKVLRGIDWPTFTPSVILMEQPSGVRAVPCQDTRLLEERGYIFYAQLGLTGLYLHMDSGLMSADL